MKMGIDFRERFKMGKKNLGVWFFIMEINLKGNFLMDR
jgi:hypothetical protein